MIYEIQVFGMDFENVESEGGWQLYYRGFNESRAYKLYDEACESIGRENVALYVDGEIVDDDIEITADDLHDYMYGI